jgi:predicted DsbA family dithiol-disulfide isomerase
MRIDIFSDPICPWCYLGKRRFELAQARRPHLETRISWRPFELNPDLPSEGVLRAWYLANRVSDPKAFAQAQKTLTGLGEAVGIHFRFDLIERIPNTRRAHLMIAHAGRLGLQSQVKERLMRAYFEEGSDIGDVDELARLGAEVGLSEYETRSVFVLRLGHDALVAAERHAASLGFNGVPTFVFDGHYTISGAQETEVLLRVLDQVAGFAATQDAKP